MRTAHLLPLAALLVLASCTVDDLDFSGKTCAAASDCPAGYACDLRTKACFKDGAAPASDASARLDAAQEPPDAADEGWDAEVVEPPDAAAPGRDASQRQDTGPAGDTGPVPDTGVRPDAGSTPDAGSGPCISDDQCRKLGAFYCGPAKTCVPCDVDLHCGPTCGACNKSTTCEGGACVPCATAQKCGPSCVTCKDPTPACNGTVCVECTRALDCALPVDPPRPFCLEEKCVECALDTDCGAGRWCSGNTCAACADAQHCGASCAVCKPPLYACDGSRCVGCLTDTDCPKGSACCQSQCISATRPLVGGLAPIVATALGTTSVTVYGENFTPCSQVLVDGVQVQAFYLSASKMTFQVGGTTPLKVGPHVVTVVNPGRLASGPNTVELGPDLQGLTGRVVFWPLADRLVFAPQSDPKLQFFDPDTWNQPLEVESLPSRAIALAATNDQLWAAVLGGVAVLRQWPSPVVDNVSGLSIEARALGVSDGANTALVMERQRYYQMVDVQTLTAQPRQTINNYPCCYAMGVAWDGSSSPLGARFILASNNGAGLVTGTFFSQLANSGKFGVYLDPATQQYYLPDQAGGGLRYGTLNGSATGTLPLPEVGPVGGHSGNGVPMILVPGLGLGLQVVDGQLQQFLGTLGPAKNRGCSSPVDGLLDTIAVDRRRSRAYVTNSCTNALEGYNLSVIFVK